MGPRWTFRAGQLTVNGQCEQVFQRATARREKLGMEGSVAPGGGGRGMACRAVRTLSGRQAFRVRR